MRIKLATFIFSDKLTFRLIRHLTLIILLNLLFIWVAYSRSDSNASLLHVSGMVLFNSFFFFTYAYVTAYILFPLLLMKQRFLFFGLSFILVGIVISCVKFLFSDYLFYDAIAFELAHRMNNIDAGQVVTNTKDMTFIVAIFLIAKYAKDNYNMRNKLRGLREKQLESEIKLIHNQLDPHVLFNNLNNLYSISLNNPAEVYPNIKKLKSLLRYYFSESKSDLVLLQKELDIIHDFVGLEQLRYGERLDVQYTVTGTPEERYIIPFVLFPFVENCFEHGCSIETGKSWINIEVDIRKNSLHFFAKNSKPDILMLQGKGESDSSLENMRNRLELLYPGKYYLKVKDEKSTYSVSLKLKISRNGIT